MTTTHDMPTPAEELATALATIHAVSLDDRYSDSDLREMIRNLYEAEFSDEALDVLESEIVVDSVDTAFDILAIRELEDSIAARHAKWSSKNEEQLVSWGDDEPVDYFLADNSTSDEEFDASMGEIAGLLTFLVGVLDEVESSAR